MTTTRVRASECLVTSLKNASALAGAKADAAVRRWRAEQADGLGGVDRGAVLEKYRVRHRRVVVLLRVPDLGHPVGPEAADRGRIALAARGDLPGVDDLAVGLHDHGLGGQVDARVERRLGRLRLWRWSLRLGLVSAGAAGRGADGGRGWADWRCVRTRGLQQQAPAGNRAH